MQSSVAAEGRDDVEGRPVERPPSRRRARALAAAFAVALSITGCSDRLPSSYVRVTAHLMHGDEPVTMDWVVECRHFQRGGVVRGYVRVSVVPYVYGVTTRDGGMVMAVAPYWCGGGDPPHNYLPLFMWGDKAGDFSFLTAYVTEDAFTNPASKLKVLDVTLAHATEAEHDAWKKTGVKNVVPAKHNPFLRNADQKSDEHRVGCAGFERIPVVPEVQGLVDAAWPPDHPVYWAVPSTLFEAVPNAFYKAVHAEFLSNESRSLGQGFGMIRREASDRSLSTHIPSHAYTAFDVVPIDFDFFYKDIHGPEFELSLSKPLQRPLISKGRVVEANIGMMYCGFFPTLFTAIDTQQFYVLPSGTFELVGTRSDIMQSDAMMQKFVEFGMDIERGEDGDE